MRLFLPQTGRLQSTKNSREFKLKYKQLQLSKQDSRKKRELHKPQRIERIIAILTITIYGQGANQPTQHFQMNAENRLGSLALLAHIENI